MTQTSQYLDAFGYPCTAGRWAREYLFDKPSAFHYTSERTQLACDVLGFSDERAQQVIAAAEM